MKYSALKPVALFFLLTLSAPGIGALDTDLLMGLNADVAPFGLESLIPGVSVTLWAFEESPLSPGADLQLYAWTDRQEISSHLYLRLGNAPVAPFAGAGWIYLRGRLLRPRAGGLVSRTDRGAENRHTPGGPCSAL